MLQKSENRFLATIEKLSISSKSEIFYIKKQNTMTSLEIQQIYRVDMSMPLIVEQFGIIANGQLIDFRDKPVTSQRRQNLFGLTLTASMVVTNNDTLSHLTDYR